MIVLSILRKSSKIGIVAPVVLEIFEKIGTYENTMFLQKKNFLAEIDKNWDRNNKQTNRCYGNSESGPVSCTDKF